MRDDNRLSDGGGIICSHRCWLTNHRRQFFAFVASVHGSSPLIALPSYLLHCSDCFCCSATPLNQHQERRGDIQASERRIAVSCWGRQKVESYVLSFFFHFGGHYGGPYGGKEDMDIGQSERSASEAGWPRVVGGEPRSLTAAGFNLHR